MCQLCEKPLLEAESADEIEDWLKESKAMKCPKCKFYVEKTEGCNHMTCKCSTEFCYLCGIVFGHCEHYP